MKPLSPGRARVLKALVDLPARGEAVTFRNIARECGLASTSTVHSHILGLHRAGLIARAPQPRYAYVVLPEAADATDQ